jgi:hypothetical protein
MSRKKARRPEGVDKIVPVCQYVACYMFGIGLGAHGPVDDKTRRAAYAMARDIDLALALLELGEGKSILEGAILPERRRKVLDDANKASKALPSPLRVKCPKCKAELFE